MTRSKGAVIRVMGMALKKPAVEIWATDKGVDGDEEEEGVLG